MRSGRRKAIVSPRLDVWKATRLITRWRSNVVARGRVQTAIEQKLKDDGDVKMNVERATKSRTERLQTIHASLRQLLDELETETCSSFESVRVAYNLRLSEPISSALIASTIINMYDARSRFRSYIPAIKKQINEFDSSRPVSTLTGASHIDITL
jgi:hypothetical protein